MDTRRPKIIKAALRALLFAALGVLIAVPGRGAVGRRLVVRSAESGEIYLSVPVRAGDGVTFQWTHSFEHVPWNEYYELRGDGSFLLQSISVGGFGAGIPAEMDVSYRCEDGMIWMEGIGSVFPRFAWIHSRTALREIDLNGGRLLAGTELPHHEKMELFVQ